MQGLRRDFTLQITHLPIVFTTANVYSINSSFFASVSANRSFRNVANSFHILVNYWNCVFWNYSRAILHIKSLSLCLSQSWSRSFHLDYNEVNFFVKTTSQCHKILAFISQDRKTVQQKFWRFSDLRREWKEKTMRIIGFSLQYKRIIYCFSKKKKKLWKGFLTSCQKHKSCNWRLVGRLGWKKKFFSTNFYQIDKNLSDTNFFSSILR